MKENKIAGIYKIINIITGEFYIGSSKNIKHRWAQHKRPSVQKRQPNSKLYKAMDRYGLDNFTFEIIEKTDNIKEREQYYIEQLKPSYNNYRAKGQDIERYKETKRRCSKEYHKAHYDYELAAVKAYNNRLCLYAGKTLTLNALALRFRQRGIANPYKEARKYLITVRDLSAEELSKLVLSK